MRPAPADRVISVDPVTQAQVEVVPEAQIDAPPGEPGRRRVSSQAISRTRARSSSSNGKDGKRLRDIRLPGNGTVIGFQDAPKETETFFAYTDYVTPLALYRDHIGAVRGQTFPQAHGRVRRQPLHDGAGVFPAARTARKCRCSSPRRKDSKLDGATCRRCFTATAASMSRSRRLTAHAVARLARAWRHLRASRTCGAAVNTAASGTKPERSPRKQNTFDDFIVVAEHLIDEGTHDAGETRDPRSQQRRTPRRRGPCAAPGAVRRGAAGRRGPRHVAVPPVDPDRVGAGRATTEPPR